MKVQVNNSELLQALGHIQSIVEKRTAKSILSNVKITTQKNKISFYTTDLDIFAKESINASVGGQLTTTVPIHIFYEIIRKIGAQKEVQLVFEPSDKPGKMLIKAGLSEFSLPCLSAEEFPDFEEGKHSCEFEMASSNLHYLIATHPSHASEPRPGSGHSCPQEGPAPVGPPACPALPVVSTFIMIYSDLLI